MRTNPYYPPEMAEAERNALLRRRHCNELKDGNIGDDAIGVALSGGGIRSATFCLGWLQSLARLQLLRRVDLLSTISGGGYIGSFLGRFFDRLRGAQTPAASKVEESLSDLQSPEIRWLRRHGNYIAPGGQTDWNQNLAVFLRNFLSVQLVIGLLVFVALGVANIVRYGLLEKASALLPYVMNLSWADMPLGKLMVSSETLAPFWSPWFMLFELVVLFLVAPQAIGYWLASEDKPESYHGWTLLATFFVAIALLWYGVSDGLNVTALLGAAPFLIAFITVEWAWRRVRLLNAAVGTGGDSIQRLRTRNYLTRDLALWLKFAGAVAGFALIDTLGHALYEKYARQNVTYIQAFAQLGAGLAALIPALQFVARFLSNRQSSRPKPSIWSRFFSKPAVGALLAPLLLAPPLILLSYASHASFGGGAQGHFMVGLVLVIGGLFLSILFALPGSIQFINHSSLNRTYAGRIARAYLGASNPRRLADTGLNVDEVMPGDDATSLQDYKPYEAGGPLHLIGTCVNETIDLQTQRDSRDRLGTMLAVSPIGLSIGTSWHARWRGSESVEVVGQLPGTAHPLLNAAGEPSREIEPLPLRQWIAISGAAFGPGLGQRTNRALSVLFTLANVRTGYWWNSGLSSTDRNLRPRVSFVRRALWLLPHLFLTQSRLLDEALARFPGPWWRYWYLSDGGHFENLGAYELIRRRVPIIVAVDAGADPDYDFDDLANFERKVRIDFQTHLTPFDEQDWTEALRRHLARLALSPDGATAAQQEWTSYFAPIRALLAVPGALSDMCAELSPRRGTDGTLIPPSVKHAALFKVTYPDSGHRSLLLYIKSTLTGDEPADLMNYRMENEDFPHQSTSDQFFDEAQWECYRRLGDHIGGRLFSAAPAGSKYLDSFWLAMLR